MRKELKDYRNQLVLCEQKAQEDFDKTVLSLSGGALGISFAFIKDIVGPGPFNKELFLLLAWISWGFSIIAELFSFYFSNLAIRYAIKQVDEDRIYNERPGGKFDCVTAALNLIGGMLFLMGVILIICFVSSNLPKGGN